MISTPSMGLRPTIPRSRVVFYQPSQSDAPGTTTSDEGAPSARAAGVSNHPVPAAATAILSEQTLSPSCLLSSCSASYVRSYSRT